MIYAIMFEAYVAGDTVVGLHGLVIGTEADAQAVVDKINGTKGSYYYEEPWILSLENGKLRREYQEGGDEA
jgi:hypothetical protein